MIKSHDTDEIVTCECGTQCHIDTAYYDEDGNYNCESCMADMAAERARQARSWIIIGVMCLFIVLLATIGTMIVLQYC